jgi:hypothetical protein
MKFSLLAVPPTKSISAPKTAAASSASFFCFSGSSFGLGFISSRWLLIYNTGRDMRFFKQNVQNNEQVFVVAAAVIPNNI